MILCDSSAWMRKEVLHGRQEFRYSSTLCYQLLLLLALRNSLANKKTATAKRLATGHQPSSNTHYTVRHRQATS